MKIQDSRFYIPPTRYELQIQRNRTALHLLGAAVMACVIAALFFFNLPQ